MDAVYNTRKKLGIALFIVGIILIAYVIGSVLVVFIGIGDVPIELFEEKQKEEYTFDMPTPDGNSTKMSLEDTTEDMYPMYNLMIWLSIAFLLLFAGYFLCKLGLNAMSPPVTKKPSLRETFGRKNSVSVHHDNVNKDDYDRFQDQDFEGRSDNSF